MRRKRSPELSFFSPLSCGWAHQSRGASEGMEHEGRVNEKVTGWGMKEVGADQLIWPSAWLRLRRLSRSPCRWGRCWWTLPDCRRYSGTSRPPSSLWGYRSLCISWPPPGEELSDIRNLQMFSLGEHTKEIPRLQPEWSSVISIQLWKHLDDMQLGQQVAVRQRHFIPVQKVAVWDFDVLNAVVVNLVRQRWAEVIVQFLQRLQESTLKR